MRLAGQRRHEDRLDGLPAYAAALADLLGDSVDRDDLVTGAEWVADRWRGHVAAGR